jgi:hypothetical protein
VGLKELVLVGMAMVLEEEGDTGLVVGIRWASMARLCLLEGN